MLKPGARLAVPDAMGSDHDDLECITPLVTKRNMLKSPFSAGSSQSSSVGNPCAQWLASVRTESSDNTSMRTSLNRPLPLKCDDSTGFLDSLVSAKSGHEQGDSVSAQTTHVKRRRLTRKTKPDDLLDGQQIVVESPESQVGKPRWKVAKEARVRYAVSIAKGRGVNVSYKEAYQQAYLEWRDLTEAEQISWLTSVDKQPVATSQAVSPDTEALLVSEGPPDDADFHSYAYSPGKLFTWNSDWLLDNERYTSLVRAHTGLPHILVKLVAEIPAVIELFDECRNRVIDTVEKFKCRQWSVCLEMSLQSEDVGRVHVHAFIERDCRADKAWAKWQSLEQHMLIRNQKPSHGSCCAVRNRGKGRTRALTEGHYYCQAPKLGHVLHASSVPKFEKTFPDSRMVTTLWRTRKMTTENAKAEVLRTRDRAPPVLQMLDTTMALEYAAQLEADARWAETAWDKSPFLDPSQPELDWARQYAVVAARPSMANSRAAGVYTNSDLESSAGLRRFKFLVYDGPSRMGKTELAMSWFGHEHTLVCNAQDCATPNLRPMQTGQFSAILFDEGTWELAYNNKTLMQASTRPVEMAQSQCNDRCYRLLLFRTAMIICSNNFWHGCKDPEKRDWVLKNCYYVRVDKPVFQQTTAQLALQVPLEQEALLCSCESRPADTGGAC